MNFLIASEDLTVGFGIAGAALGAGLLVARVVRYTFGRLNPNLAAVMTRWLGLPWIVVVPLVALAIAEPFGAAPGRAGVYFNKVVSIAVTVASAWFLVRGVRVAESLVSMRLGARGGDAFSTRKVRTQFEFLRKFIVTFIVLVALAIVLMSFPPVRRIGTSLLASAGIAGVILGIAAQRSIANLFAGIQIAFTQPIRIDDAVVVEGEWGTIEEITLTYVVVKIWDLRRLVLPINYFIEKPFQNWTRSSSNVLGTVYLQVDYGAPLDLLRAEVTSVLNSSPLWDGQVGGLQVTDATDAGLQVRVLLSARSAGELWDLRCLVREHLVVFMQTSYAWALPRQRREVVNAAETAPFPQAAGAHEVASAASDDGPRAG